MVRDLLEMLSLALEFAYWQIRTWGLSEGDIFRGTLALAGFGALALAREFYPEVRPAGGLAMLFIFPHVSHLSVWIHGERWFLMLRLALIGAVLIVIGAIVLSAPQLISQDHISAGRFFDQEVRIRATELEMVRLSARLDNLDKRMAEISDNIIWARNAMFTLLGGFAIFLAKEFFTLLMSAINTITQKKQGS